MDKFFERVKVAIGDTGTGTVTFGAATSDTFLTPSEAGAADGDTSYGLFEEGLDFELVHGTVGNSVTEFSRDTVKVSKIGGVVGTDKMNLSGNATFRFVGPAEAFNRIVALEEQDASDIPLATSLGSSTNVQEALEAVYVLPNYLTGLEASLGADADHDLNFTGGFAADDTNSVMMAIAARTKQFDATFAEGTDAGGMAAGESLPGLGGTIHVWGIGKADGTTDIFANDHAASGLTPTLPAGFTYKRHLLSWKTDGSNNLLPIIQRGDQFILINGGQVASDTGPNDLAVLKSIAEFVPAGIKVEAELAIQFVDSSPTSGSFLYVSSPDQADLPAGGANETIRLTGASGDPNFGSVVKRVITNTSGQFRYRMNLSTAGHTVSIHVVSWRHAA